MLKEGFVGKADGSQFFLCNVLEPVFALPKTAGFLGDEGSRLGLRPDQKR
jgi:hypothetical protein